MAVGRNKWPLFAQRAACEGASAPPYLPPCGLDIGGAGFGADCLSGQSVGTGAKCAGRHLLPVPAGAIKSQHLHRICPSLIKLFIGASAAANIVAAVSRFGSSPLDQLIVDFRRRPRGARKRAIGTASD